tara:strand:+ start:428 stop:871 length:444 start_codon:yes stop_codon:yes gene_type:complete
MKESIGLSLVLGILHGLLQSAGAVPVVPNFTQGSQTSTTETKTKVSETINSINYNTGYQYSVTGSNIQMNGSSITPGTNSTSNNIDGVTSSWTNLNLNNKPNWTVTTPGQAFQFTETYQGPGISNQTIIQRTTELDSVTTTTSIFSQ